MGKTVKFNLQPEVFLIDANNDDRIGKWMEVALDRHRFKRRIENLAAIINPILTINHRNKIFNQNIMSIKNLKIK